MRAWWGDADIPDCRLRSTRCRTWAIRSIVSASLGTCTYWAESRGSVRISPPTEGRRSSNICHQKGSETLVGGEGGSARLQSPHAAHAEEVSRPGCDGDDALLDFIAAAAPLSIIRSAPAHGAGAKSWSTSG